MHDRVAVGSRGTCDDCTQDDARLGG
jgi:hypothetical protein